MKARWFAPVKKPQDALEAIKIAYQATFVLAGVTAISLLLPMWFSRQPGGTILFLLILIGIGWALKTRQSRTAAIALLLNGVLNWFSTFASLVAAPSTWFGGLIIVLSVLLICASFKACQGTFGYHRLSGTAVIVPNLVRLCLVTSLYVLLYTGGLVLLWAVGKKVEWLSQVLSSSIDLVWLIPVTLICFLGGFRLLPGTKNLVVIGTSPALPTEPEKPRGYISRHWRGELTLARSFWVGFVLFVWVLNILETILSRSGILDTNPLLGIQLVVGLHFSSIPVAIWQIGGCWRAARAHIRRTGRLLWARVVQVLLVLWTGWAIVQWTLAAPIWVDYIQIATRTEPDSAYTISVLEGGEEVKISGTISYGIEKKFAQTLAEHPGIRLVELNSPGGRIDPALKLRDLIEKHGLATSTSEECNSACLLPFMAGHRRILGPGAKLGFHAPIRRGLEMKEHQQAIDLLKAYYVSRGIPEEFLSKAFNTDSSTVWFPTQQELISNGVITHTYDGEQLTDHG